MGWNGDDPTNMEGRRRRHGRAREEGGATREGGRGRRKKYRRQSEGGENEKK